MKTSKIHRSRHSFLISLATSAGLLCSSALCAAADQTTIPASGTLECDITYRHTVPKFQDSSAFVMVTSSKCGFKGISASVTHVYTMSLDFDEKGVGKLLSGSGVSLLDQKPVNSILMTEAEYVLEFDKGTVVGWRATGELLWTSGIHIGKSASWEAHATGAKTLVIAYITSG